MERIEIDFSEDTGLYWVIFSDDNGYSILAKTKNEETAEKKRQKFEKHLKEGRLLKPEKSVDKY